ncbi:hypothetical protein HY837_06710 [archaeon]|nr:hypothetical protein [archaeon]
MAKKRHNPPIYDETPLEEKVVDVPAVFVKPEEKVISMPTVFSKGDLNSLIPTVLEEKSPFEKFLHYTGRALLFAVGGAVFYGIFTGAQIAGEVGIKNEQINREFRKAYNEATSKYADTNSDGVLSSEELDVFEKIILSEHGIDTSGRVNLKHGSMPYLDNSTERVSKETVIEWLKEYKGQ